MPRRRLSSCRAWLATAMVAGIRAGAAGQGLPAAPPESVGLSPVALARIAPALQHTYVDSGKLAGMVTVIARHGRIAYTSSLGYMDAAKKTPMRIDGVFRIYSMTKPVIAVAILQLVDRGKLQLDDPL